MGSKTSVPDVLEPMNLDEVQETGEIVKAAEPQVDPLQELIEIQLFKDSRRYKEDLKVFVNGRNWVIQRGVPVKVPRYVAMVIQQSQRQDQASDNMILHLHGQLRGDGGQPGALHGHGGGGRKRGGLQGGVHPQGLRGIPGGLPALHLQLPGGGGGVGPVAGADREHAVLQIGVRLVRL